MNLRSIYPATVCGIVLLATSCDATIHEYPGKGESLVVVELNVDRTPPQYYKELVYDQDGNRSETELAPELSQTYTADERLCMRIITELYKVASTESRTNTGRLVARREIAVERLMEAPQDTLQFRVPEGRYRALSWADYAPQSDVSDWHFETGSLDAVLVKVEHKPQVNHHKSSAAGSSDFAIDFAADRQGAPILLRSGRATRADDGSIPVYLERASGRFRLWATDLQEFLASGKRIEDLDVRIIYKQYVSAGYNVDTQNPNAFVESRTMETSPSTIEADGSVLLAYDYVLTSSDREDHVLIDVFLYEDGQELNHYQDIEVPLWRNRETVIKGPFLTRSVGSGDIGIDEEFDDEFVVVIPD